MRESERSFSNLFLAAAYAVDIIGLNRYSAWYNDVGRLELIQRQVSHNFTQIPLFYFFICETTNRSLATSAPGRRSTGSPS